MSDDTGSSSSTFSEKRKKHKKLKCKSEKKKKKSKHKEKKAKRHKHKEREPQQKILIPYTTPPTHHSSNTPFEPSTEDTFGPALPPHLLKSEPKNERAFIGPMLPPQGFRQPINERRTLQNESSVVTKKDKAQPIDEDVEDFSYGPVPLPTTADGIAQMSATQMELEQRALELKLAAIEGTSGHGSDAKVREEWMLELPQVGLKSGLAALANMKRTFYQGKERPDFSDRSSWTKTPQDANNPTPSTSKTTVVSLQQQAEADYERKRDEEQARLAKKHKKGHKRDESLVDMHQKKLRKEQKKREKELAASGAKPERRPFSRDVDLKLNKIDSNQTKQIVDKAKILNTKFSSGKTKYL
ncbi:GPALPP motifs-containing protein 1 [Eurosta solidaginis]|uniref:GPALPP motifs-containing protein 1 n=1 Tax=Eurosta solidaginis TaxID=178769 RepID=UPI003530DF48